MYGKRLLVWACSTIGLLALAGVSVAASTLFHPLADEPYQSKASNLALLPPLVTPPTASPTSTSIPCDTTITSSLTSDDPSQLGRMIRDGVSSSCATPKVCPGSAGDTDYLNEVHRFTNTSTSTVCITVSVDASGCMGNQIEFSTFLNDLYPNPGIFVCNNYLADLGYSPNPIGSYSFNVPPGANFLVVVNGVEPRVGCSSYTLTVQGLSCVLYTPTPTNAPTNTFTPTPTGTPPTPTPTPTRSCCGAPAATATFNCEGGSYTYQYSVTNPCSVPVVVQIDCRLQNGHYPNPDGIWSTLQFQAYQKTLQPGTNVITGTFSVPTGTPGPYYPYFRTLLVAASQDSCWTLDLLSPAIPHCNWVATPTWTRTPTSTPTYTFTPTNTPTATPTPCMVDYTYTRFTFTGTPMPATDLVPGSQCYSCVVSITLPFPFTFYGHTYSTANAGTDGNLQFSTTYIANHTCELPVPGLGPAIMPHWSELSTKGFRCTDRPCGIYTSVSGSAPNRIFTIEWLTCLRLNCSRHVYFQTRLHEGTGAFDFVYGGLVYGGGMYATIGLQDGLSAYRVSSCDTSGAGFNSIISWTMTQLCTTPTSTPTFVPTFTPMPTCPPVHLIVGQNQPASARLIHANNRTTGHFAPGKRPATSNSLPTFQPSNLPTLDDPITFMLDDGAEETSIGFGYDEIESAALWLNRFTPPSNSYPITLNGIQILWPDQSATGDNLPGKTARLLVYQDTDGDGNPSNATLLRQLTATIGITETYENYPVNVTAPGPTGDLYIGFEDLWAEQGHTPRMYPAAQDTTTSQARSWIAGMGSGAPPDINNLGNNDVLATIDSFDLPGNWMIRATGDTSASGCLPTHTPTPTGTPTITPTLTYTTIPTPIPCAVDYTYTRTTLIGTPWPGTDLVPGSQCGRCVVPITLPFPFTFYGQTYMTVNAGTDGNLQFATTYIANHVCTLPVPAMGPAILPHWGELSTSIGYCSPRPCGIYTSVSDSAPNRIFNIEWLTCWSTNCSRTVYFEVRLHEGTGAFDFVYGNGVYGGGRFGTTGIQNGSSTYTLYSCDVANVLINAIISWTPVQSCSTPTPTPTSTPTSTPTPCIGNYTYTVSSGSIISGTTLVPGSQCGSCVVGISLPFPFTFYGQTYTDANLSTRGNMQFATSYSQTPHTCLPNAQLGPALVPYWNEQASTYNADYCPHLYAGSPCGIFTSISGNAPNRIFNIEWRGTNPRSDHYPVNFEIRFYEGSGRFDFVYANLSPPDSNSSTGVQNGTTLFTQYQCDTGSGWGYRRALIWLPPCEPTYTPTATPTPTPPPILVGHVVWEGRPPQPNSLQSLPVTLTLKLGSTEINYPTQLTDQNGYFAITLGTLPTGAYLWRADDSASALHSPNYLSNSGSVQLSGAPVTNVEMGLMRGGDASNDNNVSVADFNILKVAFGTGCPGPNYDNRADFTGDCVVNVADFNLLKSNFGQGGAPPIAPAGR